MTQSNRANRQRMEEARRRRAAETRATTPDWQRDLQSGLDPRSLLSDALQLPNLPSVVAGALGYPETAEAIKIGPLDRAAKALREGVLQRHGVDEPVQWTPEGKANVDLGAALLQDGPIALLPLGNVAAIARGAGLGTRLAASAGETALGLAVPGVQGSYRVMAPLSFGITAGIPTATAVGTGGEVDATALEVDLPTSFAIDAPGGGDTGELPQPFQIGSTDTGSAGGGADASTDDSLPQPFQLNPDADLESDDTETDADRMTAWIAAGLGAAALLGGSLAAGRAAASRSKLARELAHAELSGTPVPRQETGVAEPPIPQVRGIQGEVTTPAVAAQTQIFDPHAPLFEAIRRSGVDDEAYETLRARIETTANPIALNARIRDTAITGQLPNSRVRMPRLADHLNALSRFTPEEIARYDDTLVAMSRMDDLNATQQTVWGSGPRAQSLAQLDVTAATTREQHPRVWEAVQEAQEMYRSIADYLADAGYISQARREAWAAQRPNYVPLQLARPGKDGIEDAVEDFFETIVGRRPQEITGSRHFAAREMDDLAEGGVQPGNAASVMRNHTAYFGRILRDAEVNRIRRQFVDTVEGSLFDTSGNPIVRRVKGPSRTSTTIVRDGQDVHYEISDPGIRTTLEYNPPAVVPVLNGMRRVMQNFTTGVFAPLFATKSATYDALAGFVTAPHDRRSSRLLIAPVTGSVRGIRDVLTRSAAQALDLSLRHNGVVSRTLGVPRATAIRDQMRTAYENSATRMFDRSGAASSTILDDINPDRVSSMLAQIAPDYVRRVATSTEEQVRANTFVRMYTGLLSAVHNSARLEFIAQNMKHLKDEADAARLGSQARNLSGDMTRVGGARATARGTAIQGALSTIPYAAQSVQAIYHLARTLGNKKQLPRALTRMMGFGAVATGVLAWQWRENQQARDHYWHVMTPSQRGRSIPLYNDNGTVSGVVSIPPELRLFWSPFVEGMGIALGYRSRPEVDAAAGNADNSVAVDAATEALNAMLNVTYQDILPNPVGPGIGALAYGAAGVRPPDLAFGRFTAREPRTPRGVVEQETVRSELEQRVRIITEELLGASAAMVLDTYDTFQGAMQWGESVPDAMLAATRSTLGPWQQPTTAGLLGPLFNTDMRAAQSDPVFQALRPRLNASKTIHAAHISDNRRPGFLRIGDPTPSPHPPRVSRDRELMAVGEHNAVLRSWLRKHYERQMSTLRHRMDATRTNPLFASPAARITQQNQIVAEMRELNKAALEQFVALEDQISETLGRRFSFDEYDLERLRRTPFTAPPQ